MALLDDVVALHPSDECILWPGAISGKGYGLAWDPVEKRLRLAHRAVYERVVGPIPEGAPLDHTCRVRACANGAHVEPVTMAENLDRSPIAPATLNKAKTHCPAEHPYDEANTYVDRAGRRHCRTCNRERAAARARRA